MHACMGEERSVAGYGQGCPFEKIDASHRIFSIFDERMDGRWIQIAEELSNHGKIILFGEDFQEHSL